MTDVLAMFGGHASTVFKTLTRTYEKHATVRPFVEECSDILKNTYPELYSEEEIKQFDLMKAISKNSLSMKEAETTALALPVVTVSHLASFMAHMEVTKKDVSECAKQYAAFIGDRHGMVAAAAISASKDAKDLKQNAKNAVRAAIVASKGIEDEKALMERWGKHHVTFPEASTMSTPIFSPDGSGDIRKCTDITTGLALVLCVKGTKIPEQVTKECKAIKREAKTVVDFGCPPSDTGKLALPIDGIRDEAALGDALPDVAEIKRVINKAGYSVDVNLALSFAWLFHDLALNGALIYACTLLFPYITGNFWIKWLVVWPIYSVVVGTTLTGLWVIGHECGHRAFAGTGANNWINDVVGFVTHTALLVPFWAWRYSHHKHHMFTNHLLDGESHVPNHRNGAKMDYGFWKIMGDDAFVFWNTFQHLFFGWPLYLFQNATGGRRTPQGAKIDRKKPVSHFKPSSQVFEDNQRDMIMPGTVGCLMVLAALLYVDVLAGLGTSLFWYWGAYVIVNGWLVLYTWLHHTDSDIPHFSDGHFSYMRGATCSVDRSYPELINYVHHHIGSTHVLHHISFQVPHYRAQDATRIYKEKYPHLYRFDNRSIWSATKEIARSCHFVDDVRGVQYYKSMTELPPNPFAKSGKGKDKSA